MGRENYYLAATTAGEPPGQWWGSGAEAFGLTGEVDHDVMSALYGEFRDPRDEKFADPETRHEADTLGRAPRKDKTADELVAAALANEPTATAERRREIELEARKHARQSVQFVDATFSPVKSFTVLHTSLQRAELDAERSGDEHARDVYAGMRAEVEAALWAGNNAMLETLTERAGYSRAGRHGSGAGRWVDAHDWTVASFHQSDSREHDPQQHIHNAILNRVVCDDGEVRSLDSRAIHRWKQSAGAVGERVMEEELSRRLGVEWVLRADGEGREIDGVEQSVMDLFSERAAHISRGLADRVREFEQTHGRAPNALELSRLQQRIKLNTRQAKTDAGETSSARLERWDKQLRAEVAGGLTSVAETFRDQAEKRRERGAPVEEFSPEGVAAEAVAACQAKRPTFTPSELDRQITLRLPPLGGMSGSDVRELVQRVRELAIKDLVQIDADLPGQAHTPSDLRLSTGQSAHIAPGSAKYATKEHVAAEQALRRAAVERGRHAVRPAAAAKWLDGRKSLSTDQAAAVSGIMTSGAAVSVLVGPAGTGKSHTMGAFADGWAKLTGGRVMGVATSQIATDVLTEDGVAAQNTTRWLNAQRKISSGEATRYDQAWALTKWDAVVVDESSMVDTDALAEIRRYVDAAGARLILTGDPRQLAAVGAGGGMGMITAEDAADVHTLTEVRRFTANSWESDASLALRDGDQTAVLEYDRNGRIVDGGTAEQAAHKAADAYVGDSLDGRTSLIVTATNQQATQTAGIVRDKLVALGRVAEDGVLLCDRNVAGDGDVIQARRNDWNIGPGVVNRRRYTVHRAHDDGRLDVVDDDGDRFTLTAEYVKAHVTLAYASTAHSCQGVTVDTSHVVTSQQSSAEGLYVGMSRGREGNTAWVTTITEQHDAETGQTHEQDRDEPTAVVAAILEDDDRAEVERTALDQAARSAADADNMRTIASLREHDVHEFVSTRLSRHLDDLAASGELAAQTRQELAADQATTQLAKLLRAVEQAGHDPRAALTSAVTDSRGFGQVRSPAQVLHHRVSVAHRDELVPVWDPEAHGMDVADAPAEWNAYLAALDSAAADRRRALGTETAEAPPPWALDTFGPVPDDPTDRDEWENKAGVVAAYREAADWTNEQRPLGPAPGLASTEKRAEWFEAWNMLDRPDETLDEAAMSDGALRVRWRAWEREQAWEPEPVHDQLRETNRQIEEHRRAAAYSDHAASIAADIEESEQHRAAAAHARELVTVMNGVRDGLDAVADARAQWQVETAWTQELADRAYHELKARDVPFGGEPDRIDPHEWLEAQRAAEAEEEPHRAVTETDIAIADVADRAAIDTADLPDKRAGTVNVDRVEPVHAAAGEDDGPDTPKGVPTPAEVAAATTAAASATDQLATHRAAAAAHQADEHTRAQAELEASQEHHYRERERKAAEAAERDNAPVWER